MAQVSTTEQQASGAVHSRLTPERESELFGAVLGLLVESGYEALTMDAVAARARTSKATIYRQWRGKPGLVAAAMRHLKHVDPDLDTGSLRGDLVELAAAIGTVAEENCQLVAAVSHAVSIDAELRQLMRECMFQPNDDKFAKILGRAIERGEVAKSNPALELVPSLFISAVLSRPIIEGDPVDFKYLIGLVDSIILPALGVAPSVPSKPSRKRKQAS